MRCCGRKRSVSWKLACVRPGVVHQFAEGRLHARGVREGIWPFKVRQLPIRELQVEFGGYAAARSIEKSSNRPIVVR
jgi:hypothetical protein